MNRTYIIMAIVLSAATFSCSQQNSLKSTMSEKDYITHLHTVSGSGLEKQLKDDGAYLNGVLDSIAGFELYYSFGLSVGDGSVSSTMDSLSEFVLPSKEVIAADLNHPGRKLYVEQKLALPESDFEFSAGYQQEGFQHIKAEDLKIDLQMMFAGGKAIKADDLPLTWVDSIQVRATYQFPVQYDTLVLDLQREKEIRYGNYTIKIDRSEGQEVSFSVPLDLSKKIIEYRGITSGGVPIAANSFSKFPVTGIDAGITKELQSLNKAFADNNKDAVVLQLEKDPKDLLSYIQQLDALYKEYTADENEKFEDDFEIVDYVKTMMQKYRDVLGVNGMQYEVKFPNEITQIYLYVAREYDNVNRDFTARNLLENSPDYSTYLDKETNQYGIVAANREIIIPASYDELNLRAGLFFTERKKAEFTSYRLNPDKRTMESLPKGLDFFNVLPDNDDFYLFQNEDRYVGVLDKDLKEIIPFRFEGAELCGDVFVMNATHRGRPYKVFYTRDGKGISIPGRIIAADCSGDFILLTTREGKSGILSNSGQLTVPLIYYIDAGYGILSDKLVAYQTKNKRNEKQGIINTLTGEIVVRAEDGFDWIGRFNEGLAVASFVQGYYDRITGYINEAGDIAIAPQFLAGTPFHNGMACVQDPDKKIHLINTRGQVVKTFPDVVPEGDSYYVSNYGRQKEHEDSVYYEINGRLYDEKGEPLPQDMVYKIKAMDNSSQKL
ncbi:WG repeat-containing protein [Sphingobacterium gobiense]|nr:WG repeat-containing protein [Sphingobacterium gobiense]